MSRRGDWVAEYHSRAGPAHDRAYTLPHVCTVAVDRAFAAAGLAVPEAAAVEPPEGIVEERGAFGADLAGVLARAGPVGLVGVGSPAGQTGQVGFGGPALLPAVPAAVHPYHKRDNLFLFRYAAGHILWCLVPDGKDTNARITPQAVAAG